MFCGRGKVKRYSGEAVLFKVLGDKDQDLPFMLSERKSAGGDLRANFIDLFFRILMYLAPPSIRSGTQDLRSSF